MVFRCVVCTVYVFVVHIIALFHLVDLRCRLIYHIRFVFFFVFFSVLSIRFNNTRTVSTFGLNFNQARTDVIGVILVVSTFRLNAFQVLRMDFVL